MTAQANKKRIVDAISLLLRCQKRVSVRNICQITGGSHRDIARHLRELRAEKGRTRWDVLCAAYTAQEPPTEQPMCSVCGSPWQTSGEERHGIKDHFELARVQRKHREDLARFQHERGLRQAEPEQCTESAPPPSTSTPIKPTSTLPVCTICGIRYRPAYENQPPCCLNPECGTEYNRRLHQAD